MHFIKCDLDPSGLDLDIEAHLGDINGIPVIAKYTTDGELYRATIVWQGIEIAADGMQQLDMEWSELRAASIDGMLLVVLAPVVEQLVRLAHRYHAITIPAAAAARLDASRRAIRAERYAGRLGTMRNYYDYVPHVGVYTGVALN